MAIWPEILATGVGIWSLKLLMLEAGIGRLQSGRDILGFRCSA